MFVCRPIRLVSDLFLQKKFQTENNNTTFKVGSRVFQQASHSACLQTKMKSSQKVIMPSIAEAPWKKFEVESLIWVDLLFMKSYLLSK